MLFLMNFKGITMAEAFLSIVSKSYYKCQLSVKFCGFCQLSEILLAICHLSVSVIQTLLLAWDTVRSLDSCTGEVRDEQKAQWHGWVTGEGLIGRYVMGEGGGAEGEIRSGCVRGEGLSERAKGTNQNLGENLRFEKKTTAGLSVCLVSQWQRSIHLITVINTLSCIFAVRSFFSSPRDQERD